MRKTAGLNSNNNKGVYSQVFHSQGARFSQHFCTSAQHRGALETSQRGLIYTSIVIFIANNISQVTVHMSKEPRRRLKLEIKAGPLGNDVRPVSIDVDSPALQEMRLLCPDSPPALARFNVSLSLSLSQTLRPAPRPSSSLDR